MVSEPSADEPHQPSWKEAEMDDTLVWILVIVAVALIAAIAAWVISRDLKSRRLKQRFGPEYDRTMARTSGDRREAESVLGDRVSRHEQLELRPLSPAARESYMGEWERVQAEFVDEPGSAVQHAQSLLDEVMTQRGYPTGDDFEERADLVSVDHPSVVEQYRLAHRLHHESSETGDMALSTEERRQALVHYRALFADLLGTAEEGWDRPTDADPNLVDRRNT
jgi:ABC-type nickel/cobalt efflux system permease component RcnA